jgi:hypothetical protein
LYFGHNFYFKPYIASFALLPVIDREGLEAARFIKEKASPRHCPSHTPNYVLPATAEERHCQEVCLRFPGIRVCAPVWTIVDHPISYHHPRAWALATWKEITVYSPLACSTVSDSTLINCLSTTSPIVYTVHSPMMATVLPPAGMSPIVYMVHSLLLSPIFPVSPWHGGTFLAVSYCTFCVQHSISNHWLSLVPSCYPLNKAALDQHCSLDVCCLHGFCLVSEMQTMVGHLQTILIKLSKSNHCVNTSMVCVEDFCQVQFHLRFTCSCMLNCFSCITSSKLVAAQFPWARIRRMALAPVNEGGSTVGSTRPRYLFPRSSHKTLGHLKEPADAQCRQYQELLQKSNGSTAFLWSCSLTREEAWTYCYASYLPKVCCPLANSHFKPTFDQGAISSNHPKMRVQQDMKRE